MATPLDAPLVVSERSYPPEPSVDRHLFDQVVLPQRGRLEMQIAGASGFAGETRFAVVPSDVEHRYWAHGPNRFLVLDLAPALFDDIRRNLPHPDISPAGPFRPLDERLAMLSALLRAELARGGLQEPIVAESLGRYAASLLVSPARPREPVQEPAPGVRRLARRTRDYLEAAYLEPLTIGQIAVELGASASHMQRCFRIHHGLTIVQFLQRRRLEDARNLLLTTDLTITEVAFAAGFHDHGSFTRLFRRENGLSPSAFRSAIRAGSDKLSR